MEIKIFYYTTRSGKSPFYDWQENLDKNSRAVIRTRLDRVKIGNLGDFKQIKNGCGIYELRISYGPGFRIYFGKKGNKIIILLIGGSKRSQIKDIEKAKKCWLECKELNYE
ncbi:type II toxin-antitoxin system RelE/ParE family toxin [Candidatus Babeliales bacterium]|nr:type II toxin-antitoxin system RelE/ParE family toxin [Candidatus Babeliales bacterium]